MKAALAEAINLILNGDLELLNILSTTAKMSLTSSILALLIGVPFGIWLGATRFRFRQVLVVYNRTMMGMPPVVCGLLFYMLFSGVGPFGSWKLLFTVKLMIIAQVVLIVPLVISNMESHVSSVIGPIQETARGLQLGHLKTFLLLINESTYQIFSTYLLAFARAVAEVGAVSMVGGAIAWKTNVMTTAIMLYTNRGDFSLGIALGLILMVISMCINACITLVQRRLSK